MIMTKAEEIEQAKAKNLESMKNFKLPDEVAQKVEHVRKDLIVFLWKGQRIDLRKLSPERMLRLAAREDFVALNLVNKKNEKPTSSTASTSEPKDDKDAGKATKK